MSMQRRIGAGIEGYEKAVKDGRRQRKLGERIGVVKKAEKDMNVGRR